MTLQVKKYKKNAQGKNVATGKYDVIGNVSRGSSGGYSLGSVAVTDPKAGLTASSMVPVGLDPRGQPIYAPAQANNNFYTENNPNTSLATGQAVYTPPPATPGASQLPQESLSSGGPGQTTSTQNRPPEASQSNPQAGAPQYRAVTVENKDGTSTTYQTDPTKSFISQTGRYEFPFWTLEGQKERLQNALETTSPRLTPTSIGGQYIPGASEATTAVIDAANVGAILYSANKVFQTLGTMNKVGMAAITTGRAATIPEAAGTITKAAATAGTITQNTKNTASLIQLLKSTKIIVGGVVGLGGLLTYLTTTSGRNTGTREEQVNFAKDSGELQLKLRQAGMFDMADELYETNKELEEGLNKLSILKPLLPYKIKNGIAEAERELNEANTEYERVKYEQEQEELKAAEQAKAAAEEQQRAFQVEEREARQEFETSEREARQEYQLQQTSQAAADQARLEATETIEGSGSTLNFGLLGTGGATEFVNKDRASQYYFEKTYEELTPAQKMLLNLLKGGN